MPQCDDFKEFAPNSVVDKVPYSAEIQPADDIGARRLHSRTNTRLFNQQRQGRLKVNANRSGRGRPILRPPLRSSFYLALSARLDSDNERQDKSLDAGEEFLGRYAFFAVGFIKCFEKLSLFSR